MPFPPCTSRAGCTSRYSVSESAWKQALELREKLPQRERGVSWLVCKVFRPTGEEQGYACGDATCTLEGSGQALSPSPQTRRASAPTAVGMAGHATKMRIVRQPLLRVRCTENERADWLHKAHAEKRSLSDYAHHALSNEPMQRRTRPPEVDPVLLAAVGRAGNNLNRVGETFGRLADAAGRAAEAISTRLTQHRVEKENHAAFLRQANLD